MQEANREYQERALARDGLRRMYIGTLTLSLFLAVFGAVLLAVLLGNQLARPLLVLAEGVREVAAGDLSPKAALQGKDELGGLTRSFAQMTQQLADARNAVEQSMGAVDAARAKLQTILDNLTAGVIVLDAQGVILSSNPGATRILRVPMAAYEGPAAGRGAGAGRLCGQRCSGSLTSFWATATTTGWTIGNSPLSCMAHPAAPGPPCRPAWWRGAPSCPDATRLLVFDDISEIVSAQRAQAWGEVARRLAHEIKNPLTPIQLSAERLEMKLTGKLPAPEQAILTKSVKTIVEQVDAMKRLVNEFRDYARLPAAELQPAGPERAGDGCAASVWRGRTPPCRWKPSWTRGARQLQATPSNCARSCTTCCKTPRTPPNRRVGRGPHCRPCASAPTGANRRAPRAPHRAGQWPGLSGAHPAARV